MTTHYDWIVLGGGFRSMIGAYALAQKGHSVCLIESAKQVGGFMSPIPWEGFWVDKGPQFLDNFDASDRAFIEEMVGEGVLEDIGFSYCGYINNTRTEEFAIPDWRTYGEQFVKDVFFDLIERNREEVGVAEDFSQLLAKDGGTYISPIQNEMCRKLLLHDASELAPEVASVVPFLGRKLLFEDAISKELKKSDFLDRILAAQKVTAGQSVYNLYPKGKNLDAVRIAMVEALTRIGVALMVETSIEKIDKNAKAAHLSNGGALNFESILFGCHVAEAEKLIFEESSISENLINLPEIFHMFLVPAKDMHESYYLYNYDLEHVTTRITNFCNYSGYLDDEGYGVICAEQPVKRDSEQWQTPDIDQARVFEEMRQAGMVGDHYKKAKSFLVPSTYRLPRPGYGDIVAEFMERVCTEFGPDYVVPDSFNLTRKGSFDSLRKAGIITNVAA